MTRDVKGRKTLLSHVFEIINLAIKPGTRGKPHRGKAHL